MPLLDWVNRNQAEETATSVPYHLLKFEQAYGDEEQAKENLIIQGDNPLLEQFVVWQYNAYTHGISREKLNKGLLQIDRGQTD